MLQMFVGYISTSFSKMQLRLRKRTHGATEPQTINRTHQQRSVRNSRQTRSQTVRRRCCKREKGVFFIWLRQQCKHLCVKHVLVDTAPSTDKRTRSVRANSNRLRGWIWTGSQWCFTRRNYWFSRWVIA